MNPTPTDFRGRLTVLIPVFNDWAAVCLLLPLIDEALRGLSWTVSVILVDDGSTEELRGNLLSRPPSSLEQVEVLRLNRNLGHQRAIAIGLAWIDANVDFDAVVVMDGDGEDAPSDVPRLLARFDELGRSRVVFAARARRSESPLFRAGYLGFRLLHRALTGIPVRVGNFSVLPRAAVRTLVVVSDLWNHFAASVFKARLPMDLLPTARATRLAGRPTMNFTALVTHGLSAISVFRDRVGVRGLVAAAGLFALTTAALATVVAVRWLTDLAVPGWATSAAGLLAVLSLQLLMAMGVFAFLVLGSRDSSAFLAARDFALFVDRVSTPIDPASTLRDAAATAAPRADRALARGSR